LITRRDPGCDKTSIGKFLIKTIDLFTITIKEDTLNVLNLNKNILTIVPRIF